MELPEIPKNESNEQKTDDLNEGQKKSGPVMSDTFIGMFYVGHHFAEMLNWEKSKFYTLMAKFYKIDTGKDIGPDDIDSFYENPGYDAYFTDRIENIKAVQSDTIQQIKNDSEKLENNIKKREQMNDEETMKYIEELENRFNEYMKINKEKRPVDDDQQKLQELINNYEKIIS